MSMQPPNDRYTSGGTRSDSAGYGSSYSQAPGTYTQFTTSMSQQPHSEPRQNEPFPSSTLGPPSVLPKPTNTRGRKRKSPPSNEAANVHVPPQPQVQLQYPESGTSQQQPPPPPQPSQQQYAHIAPHPGMDSFSSSAQNPNATSSPDINGSGTTPELEGTVVSTPTTRTVSQTKRAEQNRKAQRAFRERRDQHVKNLEQRSLLLDQALAASEDANRRFEECRHMVDALRAENQRLLAALQQYTGGGPIPTSFGGSAHGPDPNEPSHHNMSQEGPPAPQGGKANQRQSSAVLSQVDEDREDGGDTGDGGAAADKRN